MDNIRVCKCYNCKQSRKRKKPSTKRIYKRMLNKKRRKGKTYTFCWA